MSNYNPEEGFPADGLWLVKKKGKSACRIRKLNEIKDISPIEWGKLFQHRDKACSDLWHYIEDVKQKTTEKVKVGDVEEVRYTYPSINDIVTQVIVSLINADQKK